MNMKPKFVFLFFIVSSASAQYNKDNLKTESGGRLYTFENLQLFPIRASKAFLDRHRTMANYTSLQEGLAARKVVVTEVSEGDVNSLLIENTSSDTVMILSGEVIQGGKQDRMLAQDVLLPPRSGKKDVEVFCVEHGRWSSRKGDMSFKEYYTISSNEVRKAATVKKDQREVWQKVAETTDKNNAKSSSGTLAELRNSGDYSESLKKYTAHFSALLVSEPDVIGVIAVSGGVIMGCDMFATHEIFAKHYPDLLNSYASQAITSGEVVSIPFEKVEQYLDDLIRDESRQEQEVEKKGTILKNGKHKVHISAF
jgi:hypothetical protein